MPTLWVNEEIKTYLKDQLAQGKTEAFLRESLKKANIPEKFLDQVLLEQSAIEFKQSTQLEQKPLTPPKPQPIIPPKQTPQPQNAPLIKNQPITAKPANPKKAHRTKLTKKQKILFIIIGIIIALGIVIILLVVTDSIKLII